MTIPLTRFLVDFSSVEPPAATLVGLDPATIVVEDPLATRIEDACRRAREEAGAEAETALASLRADHEAYLVAERRRWTDEEGARIAAALTDGLKDLEERLATQMAALLEPLVVEAVRFKAIENLRQTVAGVLANRSDLTVVATGPDDLVAAIAAASADSARLDVQPSSTCDVSIQIGDTRIRTQLEAWADRLRSSLEANL